MAFYYLWHGVSLNTRHAIAKVFNIPKRGSTEVVDNQIKSDGYVIAEIDSILTVDALQKYIGTQETDIVKLWNWMVDKVEGRELTGLNIDTTISPQNFDVVSEALKDREPKSPAHLIVPTDKIKGKRGRPRKVK
jgi:hypothetical protein